LKPETWNLLPLISIFAKLNTKVLRKFFPLDKNYVLEEAQLSLENSLLEYLVDYVKIQYMLQYNSLGLVDETVQRIEQHESKDYSKLHDLYINLMGIFRFRHYHESLVLMGVILLTATVMNGRLSLKNGFVNLPNIKISFGVFLS
jgi:hypothetical protein